MKPHTFLSSTCYDLGTEREVLAKHLRSLGHEPVLSDSVTFPLTSGKHSHAACLEQVKRSNYFVLLIGGRRGGTAVHSEKSITNEEYSLAVQLHLPIYTFVKKEVWDLKPFYAKNPTADFGSMVDDTRVFDFIDEVVTASEDNWVKTFSNISDVESALTAQFAYNMLLWSEAHVRGRTPGEKPVPPDGLEPLPGDFPRIKAEHDADDAPALVNGLRMLHSLMGKMLTDNRSSYEEKAKCLWVIARLGDYAYGDGVWRIEESVFRDNAWSSAKGRRVFGTLKTYGIEGDYDVGEDSDGRPLPVIRLRFDSRKDLFLPMALNQYVKDLLKDFGPQRGLEKFRKADMSLYAKVK